LFDADHLRAGHDRAHVREFHLEVDDVAVLRRTAVRHDATQPTFAEIAGGCLQGAISLTHHQSP